MAIIRFLCMALASGLLSACAALPFGGERATLHDLRLLASATTPTLSSSFGITLEEARRLVAVEARIEQAAGLRVDGFYLADSTEINAFAMVRDGRSWLVINRPFVRRLGDDEAALASLIGHEIAHLSLDHPSVRSGVQVNVDTSLRAASLLAGWIVPGSGAFASVGGQMVRMGHARGHEQEADLLGLDYAVRAGYEPTGALRVFAVLPDGQGSGGGGVDSHPASAERLGRLRAVIAEKYAVPPAIPSRQQPAG